MQDIGNDVADLYCIPSGQTESSFNFDDVNINSLDKKVTFRPVGVPSTFYKTLTFEKDTYHASWLRIEDLPDLDYLEDPEKYDKICGIYSLYGYSSSSSTKKIQYLLGTLVFGSDDPEQGRFVGINRTIPTTSVNELKNYLNEIRNQFRFYFSSKIGSGASITYNVYGCTYNLKNKRWLIRITGYSNSDLLPESFSTFKWLIVETPDPSAINFNTLTDFWEIQEEYRSKSSFFSIPILSDKNITEVKFTNAQRGETITLKILGASRINPWKLLGSNSGIADTYNASVYQSKTVDTIKQSTETYIR
jgi:hypothetical protein